MQLCSCCKAAMTRCCRYSTLLHSSGAETHSMENIAFSKAQPHIPAR